MRKRFAVVIACLMCLTQMSACIVQSPQPATGGSGMPAPLAAKVELAVISSFGGDDGSRARFEEIIAAYEAETGHTVQNNADTSDELWKARVRADFETGAEPDVLFFFTGADADSFVSAGKVVPIEEIREMYPDYAANMKDEILNSLLASPVDGKAYAVPLNGYWEALFCNIDVLEAHDVGLPKTWDEFLAACDTLKAAGVTPIAASLSDVPHYWWEFALMNNAGPGEHLTVPRQKGDDAYQAYVGSLNDIKELYDRGCFPINTLTTSDPETVAMFARKEAAFLGDGNWSVNKVMEYCLSTGTDASTITFTGVPVKDASRRHSTRYISGMSMGFYITRKAWNNENHRAAAVRFVAMMTTDENVAKFAGFSSTALKNSVNIQDAESIHQNAVRFIASGDYAVPAAQDTWKDTAKTDLFKNIPFVCLGQMTPEEAIDSFMAYNR